MALLRDARARRALSWLGANVVFALCHPSLGLALPPLVYAAAVSLALLVLPGVGWSTVMPVSTRRLGARLGVVLAYATLVFLVVIAGFAAGRVPPTQRGLWTTLWVVTNVGFAAGFFLRRPVAIRRSYLPREIVTGVVCGTLAFALFFWGATRVVPPQVDHDLEVSGTGYALLTTFEPLLLTDRGSVYFFAHPPLLHFYVAGAHVLGGAVDDLRVYFDSTRRAQETLARAPVELDQIYEHYRNHPRLIEARTVNVFMAAVTVALLAVWGGRITHRAWFGVCLALAFATSPEVFVRSSYGGYFAIGSLACVLMLLAHEHWRRTGAWWLPALVGVFAALADHKLVVLPLVLGGLAACHPQHSRRGWIARLHPVALGFVAGTLLFWGWGLAVEPASFVADHLRGHLLDRVMHHNPFGYGGYPTMSGLWREFNAHTGHVLLAAALAFLGVDWWQARHSGPASGAPARSVWMLWMAVTAAVFSLVDWRMTKHLVLLVIPLVLALAPPRVAPRWRVLAVTVVVAALLAFNLHTLMGLVANFQSVVLTPAW